MYFTQADDLFMKKRNQIMMELYTHIIIPTFKKAPGEWSTQDHVSMANELKENRVWIKSFEEAFEAIDKDLLE